MRAGPSRRDVARWMLSAPVGGLLSSRLIAGSASAYGAGFQAALKAARRRIEREIAGGGAIGVALAVIRDGRVVHEEGFGWANRAAGVKVTPHTPFSMASITKPFTTTTLMTLVAEGRLSLDGGANGVLGKSRIFGVNGNAAAVTVRMLGAHASGLPGMYESYDDAERRLVPSPEVLLEEYGRLAYPPASVYEYSNIGYAALNAIASSLTRTEFGALMRERVLAPLGLEDSFFGSERERVPSGATRYDSLGRAIAHSVTSTPASGELYASAHDLARFLLFNMGQPAGGRAEILDRESVAELHRPVFRGPSGIASTFGWFQGHTASGVEFFFKSGGDPGVANRMCYVPSKGLGCVVVTNQSKAAALAYGVCDDVMRNELPDWVQPEEYCGFPRTPFVMTGRFAGSWRGLLEDDGVRLPVRLDVRSAEIATMAIGAKSAEAITGMRAEGEALTGTTSGDIGSADVVRSGAQTLQIKVIPQGDRLIGRVFAVAGDPSIKNVSLPYVLHLGRS